MITIILAYLLIVLFFFIETRARIGQEAKSLERGESDRGSTDLIVVAFSLAALSVLAGPVLDYYQISVLNSTLIGWLGIILAMLGIALRVWAFRTLGRFYTRTLRIAENQHIVQEGPYHWIRHPGYLGVILMWIGAALATTNWLAVLIIVIVLPTAYYYRIQTEELMLASARDQEYDQYRTRTWKLIPYIY